MVHLALQDHVGEVANCGSLTEKEGAVMKRAMAWLFVLAHRERIYTCLILFTGIPSLEEGIRIRLDSSRIAVWIFEYAPLDRSGQLSR